MLATTIALAVVASLSLLLTSMALHYSSVAAKAPYERLVLPIELAFDADAFSVTLHFGGTGCVYNLAVFMTIGHSKLIGLWKVTEVMTPDSKHEEYEDGSKYADILILEHPSSEFGRWAHAPVSVLLTLTYQTVLGERRRVWRTFKYDGSSFVSEGPWHAHGSRFLRNLSYGAAVGVVTGLMHIGPRRKLWRQLYRESKARMQGSALSNREDSQQ